MKTLKLMLVTLLAVFGFNGVNAAELVNSTQYDTNGFQYVIKNLTKTGSTWSGEVIMKQNTFSGTSITINPTVDITVEGEVSGVACKGLVTFKIVEIAADGFKGLSTVTSITFADNCNIETIGAGAFEGTKISDLNLTKTKITKLEKLFEDNNVDLKTVELPATLTELADLALGNCIQLEDVDFSRCTKLNKLGAGSLSNTVVDEYDFSACEKLLDLSVSNPFVNATTKTNKNLATVTLPLVTPTTGAPYCPVTAIGTAFANCEVLATITNLEKSQITTVDTKAFENDKNLESLEFPLKLANVNGTPFVGCAKLATLIFNNNNTALAIGDGTSCIYGTATADLAALNSLQIKVPAHTGTTKNSTAAKIAANALAGCTGITDVQIAVGEVFAGEINAFSLNADADATVAFGDISGATIAGSIVGPLGTNTTALTIGEYVSATLTAKPIVTNTISSATIGKITGVNILDAIGQAKVINFNGDITAALAVPTAANAALETINIADAVKLGNNTTADIIVAGTFTVNGTAAKAPNLTAVNWHPTTKPTAKVFNIGAFGDTGVGAVGEAAAMVTLSTSKELADLYGNSEANLYEVKFDAEKVDPTPQNISVYGTTTSTYYYGFVKTGADRLAIAKTQNDGDQVMVYSAFVDAEDQKIYMDPLALDNGRYIVATNQVVIIRMKNPSNATDMTSVEGGKKAVVEAFVSTDYPTMRTKQFGASDWHILNDLKLTDKIFSSDYIGTTYVGKTLYTMKNPAIAGALEWNKVPVTSYLPKGAVFVETDEIPASSARLEVVWLDEVSDSEATGIINKVMKEDNSGAIYNLQGIRVNAAQKGVYIQNGKKFIVK